MEARVILTRVFPPKGGDEFALYSGYAILPASPEPEPNFGTTSCSVRLRYNPLIEKIGGVVDVEGKRYKLLARRLSFSAEGRVVGDFSTEEGVEFVVDEIKSAVHICVPRKKFEVTIE